jgi:hypothetical protein
MQKVGKPKNLKGKCPNCGNKFIATADDFIVKYQFKFLPNVMEFIKPLISEGYEVNVKVVKKAYPRENDIDYFLVEVKE